MFIHVASPSFQRDGGGRFLHRVSRGSRRNDSSARRSRRGNSIFIRRGTATPPSARFSWEIRESARYPLAPYVAASARYAKCRRYTTRRVAYLYSRLPRGSDIFNFSTRSPGELRVSRRGNLATEEGLKLYTLRLEKHAHA